KNNNNSNNNNDNNKNSSNLGACCCALQSLRLAGNGITGHGLTQLAFALCRPQFLQSLTELDLSRNRLGLEGASQIAAMLWQPTCKLARLGLAVARLRDTGVQALAAGFAARSPERSWVPLALNLRSNSIGDDGA
ncbi:unnamed protein product, partial [Polarella glacialis]